MVLLVVDRLLEVAVVGLVLQEQGIMPIPISGEQLKLSTVVPEATAEGKQEVMDPTELIMAVEGEALMATVPVQMVAWEEEALQ